MSKHDPRVSYDAVDYQTLWDTVQQDVPMLLATVEQMLTDIENTPLQ